MSAANRITDFAPGRRLKAGDVCHLQYVDNFAALGGDTESLTQTKEGVREAMDVRGLIMREHEDAGKGVAELLGHTMKAVEGTVSISPGRAWRLRDAMLHASRLRSLSGMALDVFFGHAGFCFLVGRFLLSLFRESVCVCAGSLQCASSSVAVSAAGTQECGTPWNPNGALRNRRDALLLVSTVNR